MTNGEIATRIHKEVTLLTAQQRRTVVKMLEHYPTDEGRIKAAESISKMLRLQPSETYACVEIVMDGKVINPLKAQ